MNETQLRVILGKLEQAGSVLLSALAVCPEQYRDELQDLAWRVGNLAAMIDPYDGEETDSPHPFGAATEREK